MKAVVQGSLIVAVIAVGMADAGAQPARSGAIDVCALLPQAEVAKILGRTDLGRARPEAGPDGAAACRYAGRVQGSVTVTLAPGATKAENCAVTP